MPDPRPRLQLVDLSEPEPHPDRAILDRAILDRISDRVAREVYEIRIREAEERGWFDQLIPLPQPVGLDDHDDGGEW